MTSDLKNSPRALTSAGVGHAQSIETSMRRLTLNDRNGAISYWIFTNKISSFRKLQDLSNGIFAFKIGLKMTSNEARKMTKSQAFESERSLHDQRRQLDQSLRSWFFATLQVHVSYMYQYAQPRLDPSEHVQFRRRKNFEMVFFHKHNVHASNIYFHVRSKKLMKPHSQ